MFKPAGNYSVFLPIEKLMLGIYGGEGAIL